MEKPNRKLRVAIYAVAIAICVVTLLFSMQGTQGQGGSTVIDSSINFYTNSGHFTHAGTYTTISYNNIEDQWYFDGVVHPVNLNNNGPGPASTSTPTSSTLTPQPSSNQQPQEPQDYTTIIIIAFVIFIIITLAIIESKSSNKTLQKMPKYGWT